MKKHTVRLFVFISCFYCTNMVHAQSYTVDFETVSKPNYTLANVMMNGYTWALQESVVTTSVSDVKNGAKSGRFRSSTTDSSYMMMTEDKPDGLGTISFLYTRANFAGDRTGIAPQLTIAYSSDGGLTWADIDTLDFNGIDTLTPYQSDTVNVAGNIRIKLQTLGGANGKRINIDDITISSFVIITNISLLDKSPVGLDVSPATDSLTLKFDNTIAAGTGQMSIFKAGNATPQVIDVPSPALTILDSVAVLRGLVLENASAYYVQVSAGTFTNVFGTTPNLPIDDSLTWTFSTADTIVPPPPIPLTELNESFSGCNGEPLQMGVFHQYSSVGTRMWACSKSGREDSMAVSMLGGIASGVSEVNRDWLVSGRPFDFSAMPNPILSLWQRRNHEGVVTRDIRISTDYSGSGDPELATWSILEVQAMTASPAFYWTPVSNILLDSLKHQPFYLAFTYANTTEGAYEVIYDDISVGNEPVVGIPAQTQHSIGLQVLGRASSNEILLGIDTRTPQQLKLEIFDVTGKRLYGKALGLPPGKSRVVLTDAGLQPGLYLLRLYNNRYNGVVKLRIQ